MARADFPRAARLLRPQEFTAARAERKRLTTQNFVVEYWPTARQTARLGMAVSRRVSHSAVQRNRIRRQIREWFRQSRSELPCLDLLLIARVQAAQHDNVALRVDLEKIRHTLTAIRH